MTAKPTTEYFDLLNRAVAREIQVSIQYMLQHAKMEKLMMKKIPENILLGDKTTYDAIGKFLREFAIVEMKHAAKIIERIYYLGGQATTKSDHVEVGNSLSEFNQLGVKAEEDALNLYRQVIEEAGKLGDWTTREIFEKIYKEEEDHLFKFQEYAHMQDETQPIGGSVSEWRQIFTQDYFDLLNKAVAAEISSIIQYTNQHEKAAYLALRKKESPLEVVEETNKAQVVSELLKPVFLVEMDHLEKISERIYLLEGEATSVPDPMPQVGENADEFLKLDHEAENYALVLYRKIINEARDRGDSVTRRMFEDIVTQEEEHYWTFDDYVK